MKYLLRHLERLEIPTLKLKEGTLVVPLFEVGSSIEIPRADLEAADAREKATLVSEGFKKAHRVVAVEMYACARELQQAKPEGKYTVVLVHSGPSCLSADTPGRDKPVENPRTITDITDPGPPTIGWVIYTNLGLAVVDDLPEGFTEEDVLDEFPFWVSPVTVVPEEIPKQLAAIQTRRALGVQLQDGCGYGEPPPQGKPVAELVDWG